MCRCAGNPPPPQKKSEEVVRMLKDMSVFVIKGGQLSLQAFLTAHCGALELMCLFCCKQLFLHFLILMITRRCVVFGCILLFLLSVFCLLLNMKKDMEDTSSENGHRLIMALEKFSANYYTSTKVSIYYLFSCYACCYVAISTVIKEQLFFFK